jgi:hypothetical protein
MVAKTSEEREADRFRAAVNVSLRHLDELKREDPERWRLEVRMRHADRLMATLAPGDPAYALALAEWRQLRGIHAK